MSQRRKGLILILTAVAACGTGEPKPAQEADSAGHMVGGDVPSMGSMGSMESKEMMREMRAHMQAMSAAGADSLRRMLSTHRQMTANMLQQMDTEMRGMQMASDTSWSALADSVRQDLTQLPDVSSAELPGFIERHRGRVERLITRHEQMMAGGK
jgi:hypothetical protein